MFINLCCSWSNNLLRRSNSIRPFVTSATTLQKNYYEILGLKNDCTQEEIRSKFVVLSKKHHPDMNIKDATGKASGSTVRSDEFIKVMEAYHVLSKTHSRANYDLSLRGIDRINYIRRDTFHEPWKGDPMRYAGSEPYYGVSGLKRVKHWKIVAICALFCVFGAMLQAFAIFSSSSMYRRNVPDYKSEINSANYSAAREKAEKNGNALQIEMMSHRLKKSYLETDKGEV